jgi:hypothetical protein
MALRLTCAYLFLVGMATAQWNPANPPAKSGSGMPFLTKSPSGLIYLSWIDPEGGRGHALRIARWSGADWTQMETISQGENWFVNWADFPSVSVAADGSMLAHWLARPENGGKYGYGIRVARRAPGPQGRWSMVAAFNENDPVDYAGFLSFAGRSAAYLSPPSAKPAVAHQGHDAEEAHLKTLRFAAFAADGKVLRDSEIDGDVCSCCQTASAETPSGLLIAYRDHLPGEIRDISVIRIQDGKASQPAVLHRDGWQINGCPTEGPTMAAAGRAVGIAWMTRAGGISRLQLSWSQDGGAQFRAPVRADDGNPLGRPHLVAVNDAESLLVWLERVGSGAEIRLRRVGAGGRLGASVKVAAVPASRTTGLPRIAVRGQQVLVAWREDAVRAGWLPLSSLPRMPTAIKENR